MKLQRIYLEVSKKFYMNDCSCLRSLTHLNVNVLFLQGFPIKFPMKVLTQLRNNMIFKHKRILI